MHKLLLSSAVVGTLALATLPVSAMPATSPLPLATDQPAITLVAGGCGLGFHRGPFGGCRANVYGVGPYYGGGYGWHHPWGWHGGWGWHRGWHRW